MNICLYCYQPLSAPLIDEHNAQQTEFHPGCFKQFFGKAEHLAQPLIQASKQQELPAAAAASILRRSCVVAGVQPKLPIRLLNDQLSDYLLKPPHPDFPGLAENEDLTMHLAEVSGIQTAKHTLIREASGKFAYLTRRFDREGKNKLATEDFCQLSERLTRHKYRGSLEKCGKLIDQFTQNKGAKQRFFELAIFCFITGNADMHLKNFSLMESPDGEFSLSPAYDLVNTAIAMPQDPEEVALTINGKKSRLKPRDFHQLAQSLAIPAQQRDLIYTHFQTIIPEWLNWVQRSFLSTEQKNAYRELILERSQRLFKA